MPNHVHLILVPRDEDGLRAALGEAHRRYTRCINLREGWRGHMWQERFHSFPMDRAWLLAAARCVELSPVRAGLVRRARQWPWSSARAHLAGRDDALVRVAPLLRLAPDWKDFLAESLEEERLEALRRHARTGRPLGAKPWVKRLEKRLGPPLAPCKPGRKGYNRFCRWTKTGSWDRIMDAITEAYEGDIQMIVGASVRVHHSAATLRKSHADRCMGRSRDEVTTKSHAVTDTKRPPIRLFIMPGQERHLSGDYRIRTATRLRWLHGYPS